MKQSTTTILQRQNEMEALKLLKASQRCLKKERNVKYLMIFFSFAICLIAILNRYLPTIFPAKENIADLQKTAATYINLISGAIIVAGVALNIFCSRMHTEGMALQERYEAFVFDNAPNQSILRPISQSYVDRYAQGLHKSNAKYKNYIYPPNATVNEATAQYEYIKETVQNDFSLYISIQPFFLVLWIGFCVIIMLIAVSFDDMFVATLINILIPSLSAITTICSSWYNCRLQMRQLNNLLSCIERIDELPPEKKRQYISNKANVRLLADGLCNYRSSAFAIPNFLVRRHKRLMEKENVHDDFIDETQLADTTEDIRNTLAAPTAEPTTTTSNVQAAATPPHSSTTEQAKTAEVKQNSAAAPKATNSATPETEKTATAAKNAEPTEHTASKKSEPTAPNPSPKSEPTSAASAKANITSKKATTTSSAKAAEKSSKNAAKPAKAQQSAKNSAQTVASTSAKGNSTAKDASKPANKK